MDGRRVCPRCDRELGPGIDACPDCGGGTAQVWVIEPDERGRRRRRALAWVVLVAFAAFVLWGLVQGLRALLGGP